jgi:hypothetical protein
MWEMDSFLSSAPAEAAEYGYIEKDNATFRRRRGRALVSLTMSSIPPPRSNRHIR